MNVFKALKLFFHYILTPFRFALFLLVLFIAIHLIGNSEHLNTIQSIMFIGTNIMLWSLSMHVEMSNEDLYKYIHYVMTDKKFLVVFNHTTFIDGYIIFNKFPYMCFLMLKLYVYDVIGYTEKVHKKTHGIFIKKGETTKTIIDTVQNRKCGDYVLFVAPGSGNVPKIPGNITEFNGNGAFAGKFPVLPVILKYEDESLHHNFDNGESILHSCLKIFLLNNYKIKIKVADMIEPINDETIDQYKNRVYNIMNDIYINMSV